MRITRIHIPNSIRLHAITLALTFSQGGSAQLPPNFQQATPLAGINQPIALEFLPDDRLLILLKGGEMLISEGPNYQTTAPYMTVTNVNSGQERGLIDLTLDPDFAINGHFYIYYSSAVPARFRISRFTHQENAGGLTSTGDLSSELVLWEDEEDHVSCCHHGGGIDIGPDGCVYWTMGDEFDAAQSSDLTTSGGKVLRINRDGTIPANNPFHDGAGPNNDAIWAYGLRNPFRASWDSVYGQFYIADVGGNVQELAREEVHLGVAGADYGWPACEGLTCNWPGAEPANYSPPLFDYAHTDVPPHGGSITGGFVYRGGMFPAEYQGAYFFGDYVQDFIRYLVLDPTGTTVMSVHTLQPVANGIVELEEGPDGSLFWADISGAIHRITYDANQAPACGTVTITPTSGAAPLQVTCDALVSDAEDEPLTYRWIWGDGSAELGDVPDGTGERVVPTGIHTYSSNGVYNLRLMVSDPARDTFCGPWPIAVGESPVATITAPVDGSLFVAGDTIVFTGEATDADGPLGPANFGWEVVFVHNAHTHPEFGPATGFVGDTLIIPTSGHDFSDSTGYEFRLTVTDANGLVGRDTVRIWPDKVDLHFTSMPPGLQILVDDLPYITPFVKDQVKGFVHTIEAPAQCVAGVQYGFSEWSDGGSAVHVITAPTVDTSYVATFATTGYCAPSGCSLITDGLVLQLESDLNVVTTSGNDVGGWLDQSGNGNDLYAAGVPQLFPTGGPGDMPYIRFDAPADALRRIGTLTQFPGGSQDRTLFLVVQYDEGSTDVGCTYGDGSPDGSFGPKVDGTGALDVQGWAEGTGSPNSQRGAGAGWIVQSVRVANGTFTHFKDGITFATGNAAVATTADTLTIGAVPGGGSPGSFNVAAVYLFDRALTADEHERMVAHIQTRLFERSCTGCGINGITVAAQEVCDGFSLSYAQALTIAHANAPATGTLVVNGQTFPLAHSPQTVLLSGLPANGLPVDVTVAFTDSAACTRTFPALFEAPEPCPVVLVAARAFLQAAYEPDAGLMRDDLRTLATFPLTEPFTALGYPHLDTPGESITAGMLATAGSDAVVDWVLLELRDALQPDSVVAARSVLLQRDGDVVDLDGTSPVMLRHAPGPCHVALLHRNHLGVMTAATIDLGTTPTPVDLTVGTTATWGTEARCPVDGAYPALTLWAGDANFDGTVKYTGENNDRDLILEAIGSGVPSDVSSGYLPEDNNLDGVVKYTGGDNDRDLILFNIGGNVPTEVRGQTLP